MIHDTLDVRSCGLFKFDMHKVPLLGFVAGLWGIEKFKQRSNVDIVQEALLRGRAAGREEREQLLSTPITMPPRYQEMLNAYRSYY